MSSFMDRENDSVVEEVATIPRFAEDMARFPKKSRSEIQKARGLWETGMLEVLREEDDGWGGCGTRVFVQRALLYSASSRFREFSTGERDWPIFNWNDMLRQDKSIPRGPPIATDARVDKFLEYLHSDTISGSYGGPLVEDWCFGAELGCLKYQNVCMKKIMKHDHDHEYQCRDTSHPILKNLAHKHSSVLNNIGVQCSGNGAFKSHKLAQYIIDKLLWEAVNGGNVWLIVVKEGGLAAQIMARAQVDAVKKKHPPRFAPWHAFNRHKYLLDEDDSAKKKKRSVDTEEAEGSVKRLRHS